MVADMDDYTDLEIELRQSLLKGYNRVRQAEAQGDRLQPAECVLDLLGDPQVLTLDAETSGWSVKVPLVYVVQLDVNPDRPIKHIALNRQDDEKILTPYRRRLNDWEPGHIAIHKEIVDSLQEFLDRGKGKDDDGFMLDIILAPRTRKSDAHYVTKENWTALHPLHEGQHHWLFGERRKTQLPSAVWDVNALLRLTFPPSTDWRKTDETIVTLVLGLIVTSKSDMRPADRPQEQIENEEHAAARRLMGLVRRVAQILMTEIPQLYDWLHKHAPSVRIETAYPAWLENKDRDYLHSAVDELHREINRLAGRVRAEPERWDEPRNGLNFLIAFKELNQHYQASLRYCLSLQNLRAFGTARGGINVPSWKKVFENGWEAFTRTCRNRIEEMRRSGTYTKAAEASVEAHIDACRNAIGELFKGATDISEVARRLMDKIETAPYRLKLTPGYWVMSLGHPEVIDGWLQDPRSEELFSDEYPAELLAWESSVLDGPVYYSPITDGVIGVGVCGVNAKILKKRCAYELQQIIDESGPRLRRILCRRELDGLRCDLRNRRSMLDGPELWETALHRFRRLAFYHFPNPEQFLTKIVDDATIAELNYEWRWREPDLWAEAKGVDDQRFEILMNASHLVHKWRNDDHVLDFMFEMLHKITTSPGRQRNFPDGVLHRLLLPDVHDANLLVLIPEVEHNRYTEDLMSSFVQACAGALADYDEWGPPVQFREAEEKEERPEEPSVFVAYHPDDRGSVRVLVNELRKLEVPFWVDFQQVSGQPWYPELQRAVDSGAIRSMLVLLRNTGVGLHQEVELERIAATVRPPGKVVPVLLPHSTLSPERWPEFLKPHAAELVRLQSIGPDDAECVAASLRRPVVAPPEQLEVERDTRVKIFVSYSHADQEFVKRGSQRSLVEFLKGLENEGFEIVVDRERLVGGDEWSSKLKAELSSCDIVLALVSQSFLDSKECLAEIETGLRLGKRIVAIRTSACSWKTHDWMTRVEHYPKAADQYVNRLSKAQRQELYSRVREDLHKVGDDIRRSRGVVSASPIEPGTVRVVRSEVPGHA